MSTPIIGLIIVTLSFAVLFAWVFWPSNRERFESHGKLILDSDDAEPAARRAVQGEKS